MLGECPSINRSPLLMGEVRGGDLGYFWGWTLSGSEVEFSSSTTSPMRQTALIGPKQLKGGGEEKGRLFDLR